MTESISDFTLIDITRLNAADADFQPRLQRLLALSVSWVAVRSCTTPAISLIPSTRPCWLERAQIETAVAISRVAAMTTPAT